MTEESNWANASRRSDLARAISYAEGFPVPDSIPARAHNPGDLVLGDKGHGTLGTEKITVFENDATGWTALEHQLSLIRERKSHVYTPAMTISEMAAKWTRTEPATWALNVCDGLAKLGRMATVDTPLKDVL